MSRRSIYLFVNPSPRKIYPVNDLIGEPVRADTWFSDPNHQYTVAIHLANFTGRVSIEATLKVEPGASDWFPVSLGGKTVLSFPELQYITYTTGGGQTSAFAYNFPGRFVWLRARIWQNFYTSGFIDRILLNI